MKIVIPFSIVQSNGKVYAASPRFAYTKDVPVELSKYAGDICTLVNGTVRGQEYICHESPEDLAKQAFGMVCDMIEGDQNNEELIDLYNVLKNCVNKMNNNTQS